MEQESTEKDVTMSILKSSIPNIRLKITNLEKKIQQEEENKKHFMEIERPKLWENKIKELEKKCAQQQKTIKELVAATKQQKSILTNEVILEKRTNQYVQDHQVKLIYLFFFYFVGQN